ncbi:Hypothetical protein HVR_LOCUS597 [uncultured virus]|nr:Hypothetical protein HVR_LOCUS597 [uncultured virus]
MSHSDSDEDYRDSLIIEETEPTKPSKSNPVGKDEYKEWIKERKLKGVQRFDRKRKASNKRMGCK